MSKSKGIAYEGSGEREEILRQKYFYCKAKSKNFLLRVKGFPMNSSEISRNFKIQKFLLR